MDSQNDDSQASPLCFRPDPGLVFKQLVSPTRFVGELEVAGRFILTHSFAGDLAKQYSGYTFERYSAFSRNYFLLGIHRDGFTNHAPDEVLLQLVTAISVRTGKRFDDMGNVVVNGHYTPAHEERKPYTKFIASGFWNRYDRANYPLGTTTSGFLDLQLLKPILDFVADPGENLELCRKFLAAGSFYANALRWVDIDLEKAYLDLVMTMEILSQSLEFTDEELYGSDAGLQAIFNKLDGQDVRFLKMHLLKISKRYRITFERLVDENFFGVSEVANMLEEHYGPLDPEPPTEFKLLAEDRGHYAKETYNLRSKYVHSGMNLRSHIHGLSQFNAEVGGEPGKVTRIPTFVGLERMVRYALLRMLELKGIDF